MAQRATAIGPVPIPDYLRLSSSLPVPVSRMTRRVPLPSTRALFQSSSLPLHNIAGPPNALKLVVEREGVLLPKGVVQFSAVIVDVLVNVTNHLQHVLFLKDRLVVA